MKRIFIVVMILTLVSCDKTNVGKVSSNYILGEHPPMEIVTINSCQYLYGDWGNQTVFTHKGDCNNPIHKRQETITPPIDTVEKHFDCTIAEVIGDRTSPPYAYVTECGIMFYSDKVYKVNQVVKGFRSPKHK